MPDADEPYDGFVERALLQGEFTTLQAPLQPGESGAVARWIGKNAAVVVEFSYDAEAEPGYEYDVFVHQFKRGDGGAWEDDGGAAGFDCPLVPGDRPIFSPDVFPIEGLNGTVFGSDGTVVTFGIAAPEVAVVEIRTSEEVTRSEVGLFGAVILAAEHPPAEIVLLDPTGAELQGRWYPQIHTDFTARSSFWDGLPPDGRY